LLHQGKGLVTVSGHLGNWELQGAAAATAMSKPFTVAAVQQSNPYIDSFITQRRNEMGMQVAGSKAAMKLLLRALKNKQAIGLVADQNAGIDACQDLRVLYQAVPRAVLLAAQEVEDAAAGGETGKVRK